MITNFKDKKLVEYLKDNQRVLIRFGHGWGDTQMFMPIIYRLRETFSQNQIDLYVESGQEEIFDSIKDKDDPNYDCVFSLDFPMAEGSPITKAEKCCVEEIGIEPFTQTIKFKQYENPLVCVHFNGTALPESVGCPADVAERIWREIEQAGFIPIESHLEHQFHNPANAKFEFVSRHVRDIKPSLSKLISLIQHSFAFIGVASGNLITAFNINPQRTLYLEKHHKFENYYRYPVAKVNILDYKDGTVRNWLETLRSG